MTKDTAVAVYVDKDTYGVMELQWLYRSWIHSGSNSRSDLLIFYNPILDTSLLPAGEGVIHIPLAPINETNHLWDDYPRINSTWFLTTKEAEAIHKYHYTLRTDVDCFLTKNFVTLRPRLVVCGHSMYETENPVVGEKIGQLCKKYGIQRHHMNINCHIMTESKVVTEYAKLQYNIAIRLKAEEFKEGHGAWPGWYEYVINMYSAGLAANGMFGIGVYTGGFDCMSMSYQAIGSNDYHIHAWHTTQHFSKLKWRDGFYDVLDFDVLDDNVINQYCLKMAGRRADA